ncbi:MAG: anti-sigma regulatory factor [Synechococcaceae cyanobacterium RL_1_2]|nr:anti-sigma regulatory factor [Synechococcaceae cyanobacterium RL_1_2]
MKTELKVPSNIRFLAVAESWLLNVLKLELEDDDILRDQSNRLRLVLAEAYSNVVRHAHRGQPDLPILLRLELHQHHLILEIWDYGKGYDLKRYVAPKPEERKEGGYGWLIINRLMDNVDYYFCEDGRNCLKLETNLPICQS